MAGRGQLRNRHTLAVAAAALAAGVLASAQSAPQSRIETLNAELLASPSATRTLDGWCRDRRLPDAAAVIAELVAAPARAATAEQRRRLEVSDREQIKYRRVRLRCGAETWSEADNWYVPARLTPEMNRQLETTETPFGRVVADLGFYRRTIAVTMLWDKAALPVPDALFEHRAVLYTRDHRPFAEVVEVYQRHVLGDPRR